MDHDMASRESWDDLVEEEVGNCQHRLFGGAQYHRALREFTLAVRMMKTPSITEDEIANAAGVGDMHDGVNFMRAACVIAVEKVGSLFRKTYFMNLVYHHPLCECIQQVVCFACTMCRPRAPLNLS